MKSQTFRFKEGKKYSVDDTSYILREFGNSFQNIGLDGKPNDMGDRVKCLRKCSITIRYD